MTSRYLQTMAPMSSSSTGWSLFRLNPRRRAARREGAKRRGNEPARRLGQLDELVRFAAIVRVDEARSSTADDFVRADIRSSRVVEGLAYTTFRSRLRRTMPSELVSTSTRNLRASRETASPRSTLIASSGFHAIPTFAAIPSTGGERTVAGDRSRRGPVPPRR